MEELVQFLKDNNAYIAFLVNIRECKAIQPNMRTLNDIVAKAYPIDYLGCSFYWTESPEGFIYWNDLRALWHNIVYYK